MKAKEQDIIRKVKEGDVEAFGQIVNLYSPHIFALVARVCGNREDAEELTQDTFVKAFSSIGKFRTDSSLSTWLYRIAYNTAISHLRKKRIAVDYHDNIVGRDGSEPWEDDSADAGRHKIEILEKALSLLRPDERTVLLLFYKEDKSIREIASIMSTTEGNAKTRLHRIRQKLAGLYGNLEQASNL